MIENNILTEEQIIENWKTFLSLIQAEVVGERGKDLIKLYETYEDTLPLAPGSSNVNFHNCFPGGYIDHVLRVTKCAKELYSLWSKMGAIVDTFTLEELIFAAINHDLGKAGYSDQPYYVDCTNEWQRRNNGSLYELNKELSYMKVPDRSLYVLQKYGIIVSENEYLAIKLHDGLYSKGNESYYMAAKPELGFKNHIVLILHHADHMASKIESDRQKSTFIQKPIKTPNVPKPSTFTNELSTSDIADLFKTFNQ